MPLYTFHRLGTFYPIELRDDDDAAANAEANPGTFYVKRWPSEKVVWRAGLKPVGERSEGEK